MSTDIPVQAIPAPHRFTVRGQAFELQLLDVIYALEDLASEVRKAEGTHRAYLVQAAELIAELTGVQLTVGEMDWLNDHLELEYAAQKKTRRDALAAMLGLPSSTVSTPSD